jgi:threonine dehydrogenase-like Zn-dependent dehydrogenase
VGPETSVSPGSCRIARAGRGHAQGHRGGPLRIGSALVRGSRIGDARLSRPLVLGHEFAGVIAAGPRSGERVAADPANNCDRCGPCILARRGVSVEILNVDTIKPIDRDGILASCL